MTKRTSTSRLALLLAVTASIMVAATGPAHAAKTTKLYACIAGDFKTLNLTTRRARCPQGQQKISWNVVGIPGKRGPKGSPGSDGANGTSGAPGTPGAQGPQGPAGTGGGATGATGATGSVGAQGALGPTGATGAPGPTGAQGATGVAGQKGDQGDQGATGATGPPGQDGTASGAYLSSSGGPVVLQTFLAPVQPLIWFPLSGSDYALDGDFNDVMQLSPGDLTVKRVRMTFRATQASSGISPQDLVLGVYMMPLALSGFPPLPTGASCTVSLPAFVNAGDVFSCDVMTSTPILSSDGIALGASLNPLFPSVSNVTGNIATAVDIG